MTTITERVFKMCRLFQSNESSKLVRVQYSPAKDGNRKIYVTFEYLEDWCCGRGAYILRQLDQPFKLDMVGFDIDNLFVSEKYQFDEWGEKEHVICYCLPFDEDKFHFKNLLIDNFQTYNIRYRREIYL